MKMYVCTIAEFISSGITYYTNEIELVGNKIDTGIYTNV